MMAFDINIVPGLAAWKMNDIPIIYPDRLELVSGDVIECNFTPPDAQSYIPSQYQVTLVSDMLLGTWKCELIPKTEQNINIIFDIDAVSSRVERIVSTATSGNVKSYTMRLIYTGKDKVKLKSVELRPSVILDDETTTAVETLLPSLLVLKNTDALQIMPDRLATYAATIDTVSNTELVGHLLLTAVASESTLLQISLYINETKYSIGPLYLSIPEGRTTQSLVIPLLNISAGGCVVKFEFSSTSAVTIPISGCVLTVDGKYLYRRGSTAPAPFITDIIEILPYIGSTMHIAPATTQVVLDVPIPANVQSDYTPEVYSGAPIIQKDELDLQLYFWGN